MPAAGPGLPSAFPTLINHDQDHSRLALGPPVHIPTRVNWQPVPSVGPLQPFQIMPVDFPVRIRRQIFVLDQSRRLFAEALESECARRREPVLGVGSSFNSSCALQE